MRTCRARPCIEWAAALLLCFLLGCVHPLGAGYQIESESLEARYAGGSAAHQEFLRRNSGTPPGHLLIHAAYGLKNIGDKQLEFVEVALPEAKIFAHDNLRVRVDGREVEPAPAPGGSANLLRIVFEGGWAPQQPRSLILDYELLAKAEDSASGAAAPGVSSASDSEREAADDGFCFQFRDAFPHLRAPGGFLAAVRAAKRVEISIHTPEDFRVLANARNERAHRQQDEAEHRFRLGPDDREAFVIAGRYQERSIATASGSVVFWTFAPVGAEASRAAERLATARKAYENAFGAPPEKSSLVRVIEIPRFHAGPGEEGAGASLPGVVLADRRLLANGASEEKLEIWDKQMAGIWFGQLSGDSYGARLVFGEGAASYAAIVAQEAREGAAARQQAIEHLRNEYDAERASLNGATEKPLSAIAPSDSLVQRRLAQDKAVLLFIALEEQSGAVQVRHAMGHLARSMSGRQVGFEELRSAVEQESGQDLAQFFNTWLNKPGIGEPGHMAK